MSVALFQIIFVYLLQGVNSQGYADIVNQLKTYVETNETFAKLLNTTFEEAKQEMNSSQPIDYDVMYNFFNTTLNFAPNGSQAYYSSDTIVPFSSTPTGNVIVSELKSAEWFQRWINIWCQYIDSSNSTSVISTWYPYTNITEFIIPQNGYKSLNEFFTRKINMTYRPISSPNNDSIITIPNDGFLEYFYINNLTMNDTYFKVKGVHFNLIEILGDESKAELFINGSLVCISLDYYQYHRYHSHINGRIKEIDEIGGLYYYWPNNINHTHGDNTLIDIAFTNNNRKGIAYINNDEMNILTAFVAVGVGEVSSVVYNAEVGDVVNKGEEIGLFAYGGSTIVLIFQNNVIKQSLVNINTNVLVGQGLAVINLEQ